MSSDFSSKTEDTKIKKLSKILTKYAEREEVEFLLSDDVLHPSEVLSSSGGLSLFLIEAKEIYEKIYNNLYTAEELMQALGIKLKKLTQEEMIREQEYLKKIPRNKKFPIDFYENKESLLGFIPKISKNVPCDFLTLAYFSHYTLEEYLKIYKKNRLLLVDGKIPLEPLYNKMIEKLETKEIKIIPSTSISKTSSKN